MKSKNRKKGQRNDAILVQQLNKNNNNGNNHSDTYNTDHNNTHTTIVIATKNNMQ